jgi:hypothetical protein
MASRKVLHHVLTPAPVAMNRPLAPATSTPCTACMHHHTAMTKPRPQPRSTTSRHTTLSACNASSSLPPHNSKVHHRITNARHSCSQVYKLQHWSSRSTLQGHPPAPS